MATVTGLLAPPLLYQTTSTEISDQVDGGSVINDLAEGLVSSAVPFVLFGNIVVGSEGQAEYDVPGLMMEEFGALWYNRIHVIPNKLNLGNLVANQEKEIEVWNAYFVPKMLEEITAEATLVGLNLTGPSPKLFNGLESQIYILTADLEGLPEFSGNFQFIFTDAEDPLVGVEDPTVNVSGRRVTVMPWIHNWTEGITERVGYLTDIIESKSGKEQRIRLRNRHRRQVEYRPLLPSAQDRASYHNMLAGWHHRGFIIGIWTDIQPLGTILSSGSTVVNIPTTYLDFEAGSYVMFWRNAREFEILSIESLTSSSITFNDPTTKSWNPSDLIVPARTAYAAEEIFKMTGFTNSIETTTQLWNIQNVEKTTNRITAYTPAYTYKSAPVFTMHVHDWSEEPENQSYRPLRPIDFEVGEFLLDTRYSLNRERQSMRFVLKNREQISKFYGFLEHRKGRAGAFWLPTMSPDVEIVDITGPSSTTIVIKEVGYATFITMHPARCNLAFIYPNGTMLFRKITNAGSNGDGTETLTLDSSFGFEVTPTTFRMVSYLRYVRADSDVTEIAYETTEMATVAITFSDLITSPE